MVIKVLQIRLKLKLADERMIFQQERIKRPREKDVLEQGKNGCWKQKEYSNLSNIKYNSTFQID